MVTIRTDIILQPSLLVIRPVYPIKFLLLQIVIIEASLYGCDKVANFDTNAHKPELYLYHLGTFSNSILNKMQPNDKKYNLYRVLFV